MDLGYPLMMAAGAAAGWGFTNFYWQRKYDRKPARFQMGVSAEVYAEALRQRDNETRRANRADPA